MQEEHRIRQRAYEIWVEEGRPEGREAKHWARACQQVAAERGQAAAPGIANDDAQAAAKPKAPRKPAAPRAATAKAERAVATEPAASRPKAPARRQPTG